MASKTDIVALKWLVGLMNRQAENAEASLVEFSNDPSQKRALLQCMWSVHQITSALRALGMRRGGMLTLEMERALYYLYKDKVVGERRKLALGGLMQAIKVLPAYLAHVQSARADTGQGLEKCVNDLRRWIGERPRPPAFFFHMEIPEGAGISPGAAPAGDEEIMARANVMLALYLDMGKMALRRQKVPESMKTVARIARRMQTLFAGTEAERFWFTLVGICEGVAGGLIMPDECVAQILKAGAFMIKHAREHGAAIDESVDYAGLQQQMLYYIASCKARPLHIGNLRQLFGIDEHTLEEANRGLIHSDALVTALSSALEKLDAVVDFLNTHDLAEAGRTSNEEFDRTPLEHLEATRYRLEAAGQFAHADSLGSVQSQLEKLYRGSYRESPAHLNEAINHIIRGIVEVKLDIEHKLEHGLDSSFASREFELRESVVTATFNHMALAENYLHQVLRRKALAGALASSPEEPEFLQRLTTAVNRHLNLTDQGYEELRAAMRDAAAGNPDLQQLRHLSGVLLEDAGQLPESEAIDLSLQLLEQIVGALDFAGMESEAQVVDRCRQWLEAANAAGEVGESDGFRCFAEAFAQLELHLQRSIADPRSDTSHMLAIAEKRSSELQELALQFGERALAEDAVDGTAQDSVVEEAAAVAGPQVEDAQIPAEFREVFIEEADEIVAEIQRLTPLWLADTSNHEALRDIRRHFHTFKGNGRAVGANVLGELGWAAQDLLDRVLDAEMEAGQGLQALLGEVVEELPALVDSYRDEQGFDAGRTRELTERCFRMAGGNGDGAGGELAQLDERAGGHVDAGMPGNPGQ